MGHDIYARKKIGAEQAALERQLGAELGIENYGVDAEGKSWQDRYDTYDSSVNVAYLRRSMGNSLKLVIYVALDATVYYAGVSGSAESKVFTIEQVTLALRRIEDAFYPELAETRLETNPVRDAALAAGVIDANGFLPNLRAELAKWNENYIEEISFLQQCLNYMEAENLSAIEIYFG